MEKDFWLLILARLSNLELLTKKVHRGVVECPHCQKTFTIR